MAVACTSLSLPVMTSTQQVGRGGEKEPDAGREAGREPGRDSDCVLLDRLWLDGDRQPSSPRCSDCSCFVTCASSAAQEEKMTSFRIHLEPHTSWIRSAMLCKGTSFHTTWKRVRLV